MSDYTFDDILDRRATHSAKWTYFEPDVLPMWVADMDFRPARAVIAALHQRIDTEEFGYQFDEPELRTLIAERMTARQQVPTQADHVLFLPGLVMGLNFVSGLVGERGDGVLTMTPIYPPFLGAPANQGRAVQTAALAEERTGTRLSYTLDMEALEAAVTPNTRLFLLCSPHNPTGRVWTTEELQQIAEFCLRHNLIIVSDEIHAELTYPESQLISIASLAPEVAARTITLLAPSKAYNVPGLGLSAAVIHDAALRDNMRAALYRMGALANGLGMAAALAAFRHGGPWLEQALLYLRANRDHVAETIAREMPRLAVTNPQATYLAWIDCREMPIGQAASPAAYFLEHGRVAFNTGADFGPHSAGFVRLNFGTARATLDDGLARMKRAYDRAFTTES